jgi:uncharacterized protein (DUF111 family)
MEQVIERCAGLDVHKATIAACVRGPGRPAAALLVLRDWLEAHGVTHVAMESTGVYLEAGLLRPGRTRHMLGRQRGAPQACSQR